MQFSWGTCYVQPYRAYVLASRGALCMQCCFCRDLHMQCSSHGALAMHSHAEPTSYSLSQCTLHIVQLLRSSYQQRLCPSLSRGTFNAVQLSWALSMQCSSHGHFQCSAALMGTFNAVQLSWALSMQCSSHGHFQCSAALMGTFNAVQLSWALSMQCSSHGHFQCSAALRALSMQCSSHGYTL